MTEAATEITEYKDSLKNKVKPELLDPAAFEESLVAAGVGVGVGTRAPSTPAPVRAPAPVSREQKARARDQFRRARNPHMVKNQPRDYRGRFREVLARLKVDLGESELNEVVDKVEDAERAELDGDYAKSADAATDVIQMVDRIETGSVNNKQLQNIKNTARELGKAVAFLPLPQGEPNAKLRFSDLPPTTQQLLDNMKERILDKLEPEKAADLLQVLNRFTSGVVQLSSDELQAELSRLLTYLID